MSSDDGLPEGLADDIRRASQPPSPDPIAPPGSLSPDMVVMTRDELKALVTATAERIVRDLKSETPPPHVVTVGVPEPPDFDQELLEKVQALDFSSLNADEASAALVAIVTDLRTRFPEVTQDECLAELSLVRDDVAGFLERVSSAELGRICVTAYGKSKTKSPGHAKATDVDDDPSESSDPPGFFKRLDIWRRENLGPWKPNKKK